MRADHAATGGHVRDDDETTQPCPVPEEQTVQIWALQCDEAAVELERHAAAVGQVARDFRALAAFFRICAGESPRSARLQDARAKMRDLEVRGRELRGLGR